MEPGVEPGLPLLQVEVILVDISGYRVNEPFPYILGLDPEKVFYRLIVVLIDHHYGLDGLEVALTGSMSMDIWKTRVIIAPLVQKTGVFV